MAQQLKRWESPRREGRNHKGRGGSAKQRQYKKRQKRLIKQLSGIDGSVVRKNTNEQRERLDGLSFFVCFYGCREYSLSLSLGRLAQYISRQQNHYYTQAE